jgi:hypothetical protein
MEILWVLFLLVLKFILPLIIIIAVVVGLYSIHRIRKELAGIRAIRGDATAMEMEMMRYKGKFLGLLAIVLGLGGFVTAAALGVSPMISCAPWKGALT